MDKILITLFAMGILLVTIFIHLSNKTAENLEINIK